MQTILIAGASGSGKTTLAERLSECLGRERSLIIALDSYYRDLSHLTICERERVNFDHPDALDLPLLNQNLLSLKNGERVKIPQYDFKLHTRSGYSETHVHTDVVIVEGIYALYWPQIRMLGDHTVFIDTPLSICLSRRIERDQRERGRTYESIITQWERTVEPMFKEHALKTAQFATLRAERDEEIEGVTNTLVARCLTGLQNSR
jgi:uridine kinase